MTKELTLKQIAANFISVAEDFEAFIKINKLDESIVDMIEPEKPANLHSCGTTACHAGWAGVMYGVELPEGDEPDNYYLIAACVLANKLGFQNDNSLECWALRHPHLWGNDKGQYMFSSDSAFKPEGGDIDPKYRMYGTNNSFFKLSYIPYWYRQVAERINKYLNAVERREHLKKGGDSQNNPITDVNSP